MFLPWLAGPSAGPSAGPFYPHAALPWPSYRAGGTTSASPLQTCLECNGAWTRSLLRWTPIIRWSGFPPR